MMTNLAETDMTWHVVVKDEVIFQGKSMSPAEVVPPAKEQGWTRLRAMEYSGRYGGRVVRIPLEHQVSQVQQQPPISTPIARR